MFHEAGGFKNNGISSGCFRSESVFWQRMWTDIKTSASAPPIAPECQQNIATIQAGERNRRDFLA
jgi:hypothetical protein